jgi:diacylglycerol kinase family enzyme
MRKNLDKFVVLINKTSGTVLRLGEDKVKALVTERLGDRIVSLELLETKDIATTLHKLAHEHPDGVLIGGGDGTAVCAAEILGPAKVPFAVLPLGTMNLLAQDLGSAATFEQTIERFDRLVNDDIDVGVCNDRMFLCSAVIGFVPESAVVREELREAATIETMAKFIDTLRRGMGGEIKSKLYIQSNEDDKPFPIETTSLIISNNSFVQNPAGAAERFLRESLSNGKLAVYSAAPKDMMDGLKMAFSLWQGGWQDHESISSFQTKEMIVTSDENTTLVSLDGEPLEMKGPLHFSVRPRSLPILRLELAA